MSYVLQQKVVHNWLIFNGLKIVLVVWAEFRIFMIYQTIIKQ